MPNETLIHQLETLRTQYTQQQKTASTLQTALKAIADTQNKVQKTLNDYASANSGTDISQVLALFSELRLKEDALDPVAPDLRREVKILAKLSSALKEAANALRSEPIDVVRLDKAAAVLQDAKYQEIIDLLPEINTELELGQRALGDEFGRRLRDALNEDGIEIVGRGTKFGIGPFELDANFSRRFMTLRYGHDMVVPRLPITVDAALKAYQNATRLIGGRNQDGKAWIAQLYEAYQIVRRKRNSDGTRANIVDVYGELVWLRQGRNFLAEPSKRTLTEYTRAQFIYDFYEFTNRQRIPYEGQYVRAHSATKSQTDSPLKSMWIVEGDTPYDGRYLADIEFVRD